MFFIWILGCSAVDLTFQVEVELPVQTDSTDDLSSDFIIGDALSITGVNGFEPSEFVQEPGEMVEWFDAAILSDDVGVLAGQGGFATVSLSSGAILGRGMQFRYYHVAAGDDLGVFSQKGGAVEVWDLSSPENPFQTAMIPNVSNIPVDVAIQGGNIFLAAHDGGTLVYDYNATYKQTIAATNQAVAVAASAEWVVVCDGSVLKLYDQQFTLYSEVSLVGVAKDIDIQENRIAVALGGRGVQLFNIEGGHLKVHGQVQPSGTVFSVSLDDEWLWMGAWTAVALGHIDADGVTLIAREKTLDSAMGVAANNGKAIVADWFFSVSMLHNREVWGAEAVVPTSVSFPASNATSQFLRISNEGAVPLSFEITSLTDGFSVEGETQLTIPVGERDGIWVTSPAQSWSDGYLDWKSNDPDALTGRIALVSASAGVGSQHPDFSLPTIQWPEGSLQTSRLSDFEDKVIFLAFWAGY